MARKLKEPWIKLYTERILADLELGGCSLEARGFWLTIFCLMHRSDRKGHLCDRTEKPLSPNQLAAMARCTAEEARRCLSELITAGVFSVSAEGVIYSRGMVRESHISEVRSAAGRRGADAANGLPQQNVLPQQKEEILPNVADLITEKPVQNDLPRQSARQKSGKTSGKPPANALNSCISIDPSFSKEEEEEKEINISQGVGGLGGGVLPRQNGRQKFGKTDAEELAAQAAFKGGRDNPAGRDFWRPHMDALLEAGIAPETIREEIYRKGRDCGEAPWDMKRRLLPATNGRHAARMPLGQGPALFAMLDRMDAQPKPTNGEAH